VKPATLKAGTSPLNIAGLHDRVPGLATDLVRQHVALIDGCEPNAANHSALFADRLLPHRLPLSQHDQ
jgi:hypothetical protein